MNANEILTRLNQPGVSADRLLEECRSPDLKLWKAHPELYHAFVKKLIQQGYLSLALDLGSEGYEFLRSDTQLRLQLAIAAARGGNPKYAISLLSPLLKMAEEPAAESPSDLTTQIRMEIISLLGRIYKDQSLRSPLLARLSAEAYERAATLPGVSELPDGGVFPLLNAASMWRITGDVAKSIEMAREVIRRIEQIDASEMDSLWRPAMLGEANLLIGRHEEAVKYYLDAINQANYSNRLGDLASIRNNLQRLSEVGVTAETAFLDRHLGSVVVFSGHLIDSPDCIKAGHPPRFPNIPTLIQDVKNEIARQLEEFNARVGFSSLACGGDILFAEAMIEGKAELNIVLPFAQHDFLRTSVNFGQTSESWRQWRSRFDRILDQIPSHLVRYTTTEPYLGSRDLFEFSNNVLHGLAVIRSRERASIPKGLFLVDRSANGQQGGTRSSLDTWLKEGFPAVEIHLDKLREAHNPFVP